MKIRIIDFETTGTPEDQVKAICEVGYTDIYPDGTMDAPVGFFVNPGHPIPPETRAIHHISDADVATAMNPTHALMILAEGMQHGDIYAAHNAAFEQAFCGGGHHEWICTYKCAQHLFPEAPKHSNQVLRYWLGFDEKPEFQSSLAMPPHRAAPDTYVTAFLLQELLKKASISELVGLSTAPVLLRKVTFGMHRGKQWKDLPWDYLSWIANKSDLGADEKHTARHYLKGV